MNIEEHHTLADIVNIEIARNALKTLVNLQGAGYEVRLYDNENDDRDYIVNAGTSIILSKVR